MSIRESLQKPYFAHSADEDETLPGYDFNRAITPPGKNENFPDGAIGIYADSDFWCVAALPYSYLNTPLREIVDDLWPQYKDISSCHPDHGSVEQAIEYTKNWAESRSDIESRYKKERDEMQRELDRLRDNRQELKYYPTTRKKAMDNYFIRQYQMLLNALAHEFTPQEKFAGLCSVCGLNSTDRVHDKHYIELRAKGFYNRIKIPSEYPNDDFEDEYGRPILGPKTDYKKEDYVEQDEDEDC